MRTTPNSQPPNSSEASGFKLQSVLGWIIQPFKWYEARLISIVKEQITNEKVGELEKKISRLEENKVDNLQTKIDEINQRINQIRDDTISNLEAELNIKLENLKQNVPKLAFSPLKEEFSLIREDLIKAIKPIIDLLIKEKIAEIERSSVAGSIVELQQLQAQKKELETAKAELEKYLIKSEACREAATWLADNRENLAKAAVQHVLKEHPELKNSGEAVDSPEKIKRLSWDIDDCLDITSRYLARGEAPELLLRGITDEPALTVVEPYVRVLEFIRDHKISEAESVKEISGRASEELRGYLNYIINNANQIFLKDLH